jgi:phosphatidylinositol alpha-1,6-mannosyltransferase
VALGFDERRAHVIPYGVDASLFTAGSERRARGRARLGLPADATVLLGVGRMATKKGFQRLVAILPELLRRHPDLHLVLAGGGDRLAELRAATAALDGRVQLPGSVPHDQLPELYAAADLFVLPAVHDAVGNVDGLPNVVLEAMASGLAVVASGISGIPLAVTHGAEGLLVGEHDDEGLLDALSQLAGDAGRRRTMGAAARRRVEAELTWEAVAARYRAAFAEALAWRRS